MARSLAWAVLGALVGFGVSAFSQTLVDLVAQAPSAVWYNDLGARLPFPGADTDDRGFAQVLPSAVLEDGNAYPSVLETHPRWQPDGAIEGRYILTIPANAEFVALVGFLRGASGTDGVTFEVLWQGRILAQVRDTYDGNLKEIRVDLSSAAGQRGELILRVKAGASSGQDWAVWVQPKLARKGTVYLGAPIYVRIFLDSLYCERESRWDHGTDSDEPYLLVTAFAGHRSPSAWSTGDAEVFSDVDSGENRRLSYTRSQRLVFEGEVPPGARVGFNVVVMESDAGTETQRNRLAREIVNQLVVGPLTGLPNMGADPLSKAITDFLTGNFISFILAPIMYGLGGGADDFVATNSVVLTYDQLRLWSSGDPHRPMTMELRGGEESRYRLRWHIEFDREASRSFSAKFTHWDELAVGNILEDREPEILIVIDEDAPGDDGRFYIKNKNGRLLASWNGFYTHYDRVVIGDVLGDERAEIIVASDDDGGRIRIYDGAGNRLRYFTAPFTKYDGLAVGNVLGDGKAEIIVARDDDCQVFIYNADGQRLRAFLVDAFSGCRYTAELDDERHDGFAVGDVLGDSFAEIIIAENHNGPESLVHVYDAFGQELRRFTTYFTHLDGFILANMVRDGKKEIVVAVDGGDGQYGDTIYITDVATGSTTRRYWPIFTKYDGLASGDFDGDGKDEIVLATDEDWWVYIGK